MLDQGMWDQNSIIAIILLSPQAPKWRKKQATLEEKGAVMAERSPKGMTHMPKIGTVVRLAGMDTREIR